MTYPSRTDDADYHDIEADARRADAERIKREREEWEAQWDDLDRAAEAYKAAHVSFGIAMINAQAKLEADFERTLKAVRRAYPNTPL